MADEARAEMLFQVQLLGSEPTWTAIAMAESGGNTDAHAPHGEDSWGLWQINVDPAGDTADLWEWRKQVEDGTLKDTLDFQPQLTTEPTAPEGGHVKVFSGRDMSEPTAPAGDDGQMFAQILQQVTQGGSPPDAFDFTTKPTEPEQIKEVLVTSYNMGGDPLKFAPETDDNALTVDPTDPNASVPAHTPEWSNLRSSSDPMETPGHDDAAYSLGQSMGFSPDVFDFTTKPTAPDGFGRTKTYFGVTNANCDKLNDGGIIIDWTPGPDDDGFLIVYWLAEDHVDPSDPSLDPPIAEFAAETTGNARLGWELHYAYATPLDDGGTHEGWVLL